MQVEIAAASIATIKSQEFQIDAYLAVMEAQALVQAKEIDRKKAAGEKLGALAGTTVALKDNMATIDVKTTCASKILENWMPVYDATVVTKLKQADAIIVGKTNLDEFAMGSSTENSAFKTTKNPHDVCKVPGGSSGGFSSNCSCRSCYIFPRFRYWWFDPPRLLCGIVGVKPTYGCVSRYGLVAFGSSLE